MQDSLVSELVGPVCRIVGCPPVVLLGPDVEMLRGSKKCPGAASSQQSVWSDGHCYVQARVALADDGDGHGLGEVCPLVEVGFELSEVSHE